MSKKRQYYQLDDIGFIGTQDKNPISREEQKAISDFIKADKLKTAQTQQNLVSNTSQQ